MSGEELIYNLYLLENLCNYEEKALIEADKLEYLTKEGEWKSFTSFDLKYIPILVKAIKRTKSNQEITYELSYKLLLPNVEITPEKTERITISKTKKGLFTKKYNTLKNEQVFENAIIRYYNKSTNTFSKLKTEEKLSTFTRRNRGKLHNAATIIGRNINKTKKLTLK